MADTETQIRQDVQAFKERHGETATVTTLMKEFDWWAPDPERGGDGRRDEGTEDQITRQLFDLADRIEEAVYNRAKGGSDGRKDDAKPVLNHRTNPFPERFDVSDISTYHGGEGKRGVTTMENYEIRLDDDFVEFTQSLV